jgi:hypothetical protein
MLEKCECENMHRATKFIDCCMQEMRLKQRLMQLAYEAHAASLRRIHSGAGIHVTVGLHVRYPHRKQLMCADAFSFFAYHVFETCMVEPHKSYTCPLRHVLQLAPKRWNYKYFVADATVHHTVHDSITMDEQLGGMDCAPSAIADVGVHLQLGTYMVA